MWRPFHVKVSSETNLPSLTETRRGLQGEIEKMLARMLS